MAEFQKVSFEEFKNACNKLESNGAMCFSGDDEIRRYYDAIQLPRRATPGSAGYDFFLPFPVAFTHIIPVMIPTGIRVRLDPGTFLMCVPRSGLGFKYGMKETALVSLMKTITIPIMKVISPQRLQQMKCSGLVQATALCRGLS